MEQEYREALASLPISSIRFFQQIGSTNDEALQWASEGAPDLSLVIAEEQTKGRGRAGRKWSTPPGAALAFSLILRPAATDAVSPSLLTGLGALALVDALNSHGLSPQIKWPNDVLLGGKKAAGILVESAWTGEKMDYAVVGVGVNVKPESVPPPEEVSFPAACVEAELGQPVDRAILLRDILFSMAAWRGKMGKPAFIRAWEQHLAFKEKTVHVWAENRSPLIGRILGLESDGGLRLRTNDKTVAVQFGEVHLRPGL
jgi:BirA family biotin operon repressor/biotin-[acetyl-CoA-carboxylase] ligase